MEIVCFDMEGTLTPEIWEQVAKNTGIDEFNKTTRDIPSYGELMDFRLDIMSKHDLKLHDIQKAASELDLLPGAEDFINRVRQNFQVVILSDTFHEIAQPLMQKLGFPLLLCHNLGVEKDGGINLPSTPQSRPMQHRLSTRKRRWLRSKRKSRAWMRRAKADNNRPRHWLRPTAATSRALLSWRRLSRCVVR